MTYRLLIGDESFSSWSLRAWLMFEKFGVPYSTELVGLYTGTMSEDLRKAAPARLVPVARLPDGTWVGDTLAIAETLVERHPEIAFWPADPESRALARWIVAEMHSGFAALREACPMYLRHAWHGFEVPSEVQCDLARIEKLWALSRERSGVSGSPWLFRDYSLADAFYAPVAARIAGYRLPVGDAAMRYVEAHLADPAFRRWRARGQARSYEELPYGRDLEVAPWPGPSVIEAKAMASGQPENEDCPYSGKPVTHFLEIDHRVFGFCNAFCRDKTVADPEAWPAFSALLERND